MTSMYIEDLGIPEDEEFPAELVDEDSPTDEPESEDEILDPTQAGFLDELVKRVVLFCEEFSNFDLRPYQRSFGYRIVQSLILGDADELTGLWSRQSGKTETIADILAGCMILFPKLATTFPQLEKFKRGLYVGVFAPVDEQADLVFSRIVSRLTSDHAVEFLADPELDEKADGKSKFIKLRSGSFARRQTASPRAKIEGSTYHVIVIDEAQDADDQVVSKSIHPMLAAYAGTMIKIGTPGYHKGDFYRAINLNKRQATGRGRKQNHFEYDWKVVAKYNPHYKKFVEKEKVRFGEDSDEFQMAYCLKWMLERGMLIVEDELDGLADPSMELQKAWHRTPCVAGIDPARIRDSTVVTVMWVDWDFPDPAGYREHRILNWLEIKNTSWEEQYFEIMDFLDNYNLAYVAVDANGMGSPVAERMQRLLGSRCDVIAMPSDAKNQAERVKHLITLLQRRLLIYPGHSKARRTRVWKRFRQQMSDAEKVMKGQYLLVQAPEEREAHDDFVDSAALAAACTILDSVPQVESFESPFYRGG